MSSASVAAGFEHVEGSVTAIDLYCCLSVSAMTLSQVLAVCHAPGMKTSVGFGDIVDVG